MVVAKKPAKPRTKRTSALRAAAPKKTAAKAEASESAPAPSAPNVGKFSPGDPISHPMFGDGTVVAIDADKLTIEFEGNVVKQIVDYYVKPRKP